MKNILATILLFIGATTMAQKPNIDSLKTLLQNELEMAEYNKLLGRYMDLDTTLLPEDFHFLYYGYVAHPNYAPNRKIEEEDEFVRLVNEFSYEEAAKLGNVLFAYDPFNIDLIFGMVISSEGEEQVGWTFLYRKVCEAIFESGNGETDETAWVVISVQNEYSFLEALGLNAVSLEEIDERMDKFTLSYPNDFGLMEVYFDHSEAYFHFRDRK